MLDAVGAGVVNGVQSSLQSLLQSFSYLMGLIVWQPEKFGWLMAGSVGVVTVATALFCCYLASEADSARGRGGSLPVRSYDTCTQMAESTAPER